MNRLSPIAALTGASTALAVAAVVNTALAVLAGETLVVVGELGPVIIALYTLAMVVPAWLLLWLVPRWFPVIVIAGALLTVPFAFSQFGSPIAIWLTVMLIVAGVCAAVLGPKVAARTPVED